VSGSNWVSNNFPLGQFQQYTVRVTGNLTHISDVSYTSFTDARRQLVACTAIGESMGITSLQYAFAGCTNLVTVPRIIPKPIKNPSNPSVYLYAGITSLHAAFLNCEKFNGNINDWDVSNVQTMWIAFQGCLSFNSPLDKWDVSRVTGINGFDSCFTGCRVFNQNLNAWGPKIGSNGAYSIDYMFRNCAEYNQPMDSWNLSNVNTAIGVFAGCTKFNSPIGDYKVEVNLPNFKMNGFSIGRKSRFKFQSRRVIE
jgi:hypothetical protein